MAYKSFFKTNTRTLCLSLSLTPPPILDYLSLSLSLLQHRLLSLSLFLFPPVKVSKTCIHFLFPSHLHRQIHQTLGLFFEVSQNPQLNSNLPERELFLFVCSTSARFTTKIPKDQSIYIRKLYPLFFFF